MIHITETYSLTDCLYLCSIKCCHTDRSCDFLASACSKTHTAEQCSVRQPEYITVSLILINQGLMLTSSWWCRKVERW